MENLRHRQQRQRRQRERPEQRQQRSGLTEHRPQPLNSHESDLGDLEQVVISPSVHERGSERIETASKLRDAGHTVAALVVLEHAVQQFPEDRDLDITFQSFLSTALEDADQAVRACALEMLERSTRPWAKLLLDMYHRVTTARPAAQPLQLRDETFRGSHVAPPSPPLEIRPSHPRHVQSLPPRSRLGPAHSKGSSPASLSGYPTPSQVKANSGVGQPVHTPASPVGQDIPEQGWRRREIATPVLRFGFMDTIPALAVAVVIGALVGASSMVVFAILDSPGTGALAGALGAVLGTVGARLVVSVLFGNGQRDDLRVPGTRVLVALLGAVLGGLTVLLVSLLSEALGYSLVALLARALPNEGYATGLWVSWGMLGGLVWSGHLLHRVQSRVRKVQRA